MHICIYIIHIIYIYITFSVQIFFVNTLFFQNLLVERTCCQKRSVGACSVFSPIIWKSSKHASVLQCEVACCTVSYLLELCQCIAVCFCWILKMCHAHCGIYKCWTLLYMHMQIYIYISIYTYNLYFLVGMWKGECVSMLSIQMCFVAHFLFRIQVVNFQMYKARCKCVDT